MNKKSKLKKIESLLAIWGIVASAFVSIFPLAEIVTADDSDGDGMDDAWEEAQGLDPGYPSDAWYDMDGDGYRNLAEYHFYFIGEIDEDSVGVNSKHPTVADEDDTDNDGVCNFGEYLAGTDHTDSENHPVYTIDNDGDGVNDSYDTDGDGLTDVWELTYGNNDATTYSIGEDLSPCDPDTDHDGYQRDSVDDDGTIGEPDVADGIRDPAHTVGVDQPWMDYDDDCFIEGFNDAVEVRLDSNPLYPNTWEAFHYGYNFYPGVKSYFNRDDNGEIAIWGTGLHRYLGDDNVDFTAPSLAVGHSLTEYINDIKNDDIGENTIDPTTCEASVRDGWILVQHNYGEDGTIVPDIDYPYELYYNIWDGTFRLYARHQVSGNYDYGKIEIFDDPQYSRPLFLNNGIKSETILDHKDVYAGSDNTDREALIRGRYFFSDFYLNYVEIEKSVNDYFYLKRVVTTNLLYHFQK